VDKALLLVWRIATGNESGLLTTLKTLGLIDEEGSPTDLYREMRLSTPRRVAALGRAVDFAYPGLAPAGVRVDDNQLFDYFIEERGLTGQMVEKAIRFYRQLLDAAQQDLTPGDADDSKSGSPVVRSRRARQPTSSTPLAKPPAAELAPILLTPALPVPSPALNPPPRDPQLAVVVQIDPTSTEDELAELFQKVRRAWDRSRQVATD
jgi:hypothetical protein